MTVSEQQASDNIEQKHYEKSFRILALTQNGIELKFGELSHRHGSRTETKAA